MTTLARLRSLLAAGAAGLVLLALPSAAAVPAPAASSRSVTSLGLLPDHVGGASSMLVRGSRLFVLDQTLLTIYDVRRPAAPVRLGALRTGGRHFPGALQASADGTRLLLTHHGYVAGDEALVVYDLRRPQAPVEVGRLDGVDENVFCLASCRWAYGSRGSIFDLADTRRIRQVARPRTAQAWNRRARIGDTAASRLEEVRPGVLLAATSKGVFDDRLLPLPVLDVRDPRNPRRTAAATGPSERESFTSAQWPRRGADRFLLAQTVFNGEDLFCTSGGGLVTYERTATGTFVQRSRLALRRGTYLDGSPAANPLLSCGGGRFDAHPAFRDGGLVLTAQLEHGVRAVAVDREGQSAEVGHHLPVAGYASQVSWASRRADERIAYLLDTQRGIEVLRWDGPLGP